MPRRGQLACDRCFVARKPCSDQRPCERCIVCGSDCVISRVPKRRGRQLYEGEEGFLYASSSDLTRTNSNTTLQDGDYGSQMVPRSRLSSPLLSSVGLFDDLEGIPDEPILLALTQTYHRVGASIKSWFIDLFVSEEELLAIVGARKPAAQLIQLALIGLQLAHPKVVDQIADGLVERRFTARPSNVDSLLRRATRLAILNFDTIPYTEVSFALWNMALACQANNHVPMELTSQIWGLLVENGFRLELHVDPDLHPRFSKLQAIEKKSRRLSFWALMRLERNQALIMGADEVSHLDYMFETGGDAWFRHLPLAGTDGIPIPTSSICTSNLSRLFRILQEFNNQPPGPDAKSTMITLISSHLLYFLFCARKSRRLIALHGLNPFSTTVDLAPEQSSLISTFHALATTFEGYPHMLSKELQEGAENGPPQTMPVKVTSVRQNQTTPTSDPTKQISLYIPGSEGAADLDDQNRHVPTITVYFKYHYLLGHCGLRMLFHAPTRHCAVLLHPPSPVDGSEDLSWLINANGFRACLDAANTFIMLYKKLQGPDGVNKAIPCKFDYLFYTYLAAIINIISFHNIASPILNAPSFESLVTEAYTDPMDSAGAPDINPATLALEAQSQALLAIGILDTYADTTLCAAEYAAVCRLYLDTGNKSGDFGLSWKSLTVKEVRRLVCKYNPAVVL